MIFKNDKIKSVLKFSLNKITTLKFIYIWFVYCLIISISSIIFGYLLHLKFNIYDENFDIIFKSISFSNGELIHNLYYKNQYYTEFMGIKFYLQKTPAIPYLIYLISTLSKNFFFIIICKNLIFYSIYFLICLVSLKSIKQNLINFLIILFIPIIIPYNFTVSLNFFYEDSLIALLIPCVYLLLITEYKKKFFILGLLCFVLYFVKTSILFVIIIIPIIILFYEKNNAKKIIPLLFSLLAIIIWGVYGYAKTERFAFLSTSSSINSFVMSFAYNKNFHKYYPNKSTDLIPIDLELPKNIKNEWEFYDHYKQKNLKYINENLDRYIEDFILKIKFILFGIKRDSAFPDINGNYDNKVRISQVISKIILNFSFFVIALKAFKNLNRLIKKKEDVYFITIILLSLLPHLLVWATSKHLIGIVNICLIYLTFNYLIKLKSS